jgi:hypothetical protein
MLVEEIFQATRNLSYGCPIIDQVVEGRYLVIHSKNINSFCKQDQTKYQIPELYVAYGVVASNIYYAINR